MSSALLDELIDLVSQQMCWSPHRPTPESSPASLGSDSLDLVEMAIEIEESFGVSFRDAELERINTMPLSELARVIEVRA